MVLEAHLVEASAHTCGYAAADAATTGGVASRGNNKELPQLRTSLGGCMRLSFLKSGNRYSDPKPESIPMGLTRVLSASSSFYASH